MEEAFGRSQGVDDASDERDQTRTSGLFAGMVAIQQACACGHCICPLHPQLSLFVMNFHGQ